MSITVTIMGVIVGSLITYETNLRVVLAVQIALYMIAFSIHNV